jgi:hypothetical protein
MKKKATKEPEKPTREHEAFTNAVKQIIGPSLEKLGFTLYSYKYSNSFISIVYLKPTQFIKIDGSTNWQDGNSYYNINLGTGPAEKHFATEWYSVALWHLKKTIEPSIPVKEYSFPLGGDIIPNITKANEELLKYGDGFFKGDLAIFNEIVKKLSKGEKI